MSSSFRGRDDSMDAGAGGGGVVGLPEAEARRLFKGVVEGVKALHEMGIVHGDVKAENVLIDAEVSYVSSFLDLCMSDGCDWVALGSFS